MNDFNADLNKVLKFSADHSTVEDLIRTLAENPEHQHTPDSAHRLVTADALQEVGRESEANLLRSKHPVYVWRGKVFKANGAADFAKWFRNAYHESARWASVGGEDGTPLDSPPYSEYGLHENTEKEMDEDAAHFFHSYRHLFGEASPEQAGHDFWLTRNRHGTGFWDRPEGMYTDEEGNDTRHLLTDAAHSAGEYNLDADEPDEEDYTAGKIYGMGGSKKWGQEEGLHHE